MANRLNWVKRSALLGAAFLGLAAPAALAAQPAAPAADASAAETAPRPAIWLIEDEDTKIYLFGTVHVFPATMRWRSPALERVIREADELVMETADASMSEVADGESIFGQMRMGKSVPILERVSPAARPRLQAALTATGMPLQFFDELHTWAVAMMLMGFQVAQYSGGEDAVPLSGAEEELGALFRKSKRPISGVETSAQQMSFFARLPIGAQRRFLESLVAEGEPEANPEELTDRSWVRGDVEAIGTEMQALSPELYDVLLTQRNRNWTAWLVQRMEKPGTVLFAVGAGHLAGPDSVQRMLAERGLQSRRID